MSSRSWPRAEPGPSSRATSRSSSRSRACSCRRTRGSSRRPGSSPPTSSTSSWRPSGMRSRASTSTGCAPATTSSRRRPWRSSTRTACRRTGASCGAWRTAATPARATRSASTCPPGEIDEGWVDELKDAFHRAHEAEYGHRFDAEIEIVNIRVVGIGRIAELEPTTAESGGGDPSDAKTLEREVVFDVDGRPERRATPFYDRARLRAGDRIEGPAIIEQYDSTTVVPPGLSAEIDRFGNIVIDCSQRVSEAAERSHGARHADPHARDRRRLLGDREGDGRRALPDELLIDHPGVRGPRRRHLRRRGERPRRVRLDADVHGRDAEDRQERHQAPRRRHPRGRRRPAQRPLPRRDPLTGRGDRDPDLLRREARRVRGRVRPPPRHRRAPTPVSRSTSSTTGRRATSTARSSSPRRASGRRPSGSTSSRTRGRRRTTRATSRR